MVKTKLKGTAINLLKGTETTLQQVIQSLKENVKGESIDVITAKLMNVKQVSKNANSYIKEVEELTKSLQSAYISDGLTLSQAERYSTKAAVKAMSTNAANDRIKMIMQAGQFNTLPEAVAKFINCCTENNGQQNAVLYYGNNRQGGNSRWNNRGNYRGNRRGNSNSRGRGNYRNYGDRQYYGGNNNNRGRGNNRRTHNNGNNVRVVNDQDNGSENTNQPLRQ